MNQNRVQKSNSKNRPQKQSQTSRKPASVKPGTAQPAISPAMVRQLKDEIEEMHSAVCRVAPLLRLLANTIFEDRKDEAINDAIGEGVPRHTYMGTETMQEATCFDFLANDVATLLGERIDALWIITKQLNAGFATMA
jgi:hypothetical protein